MKVLDQGAVTRRVEGNDTATAAGSRCAPAGNDVVCTYMLQKGLGSNDFKPTISRSSDGGRTWRDERFIWPHLVDKWSIFGAVREAPNGDLMYFGSRTPIEKAGETFWSEANTGLKQNELIWARSTDGGRTFSEPAVIPMQIPGAAEAPGALCVTKGGRWWCCYAPYNTFDPNVKVDRAQLAGMYSDDQGRTWKYKPIMKLSPATSGAAEAWVIQLAGGRMLATTWHFDYGKKTDNDFPNAYAISDDEGTTWQGPFSTNLPGQSTTLAALPDGRAVMLYNQRRTDPKGVYMAIARPSATGFGIEKNEPVWVAQTAMQKPGDVSHEQWTSYSFGEPSVLPMKDGTLLVTLWCIQPQLRGIAWVRVKLD